VLDLLTVSSGKAALENSFDAIKALPFRSKFNSFNQADKVIKKKITLTAVDRPKARRRASFSIPAISPATSDSLVSRIFEYF